MTQQTTTRQAVSHPRDAATRDRGVTRSLLGYGVVAAPCHVGVSLAQAVTRDGFDLTRHAWSMLSNGDLGWIHITNLVLTGSMVLAFALGLRRALPAGPGHTWAPRLIGGYGGSLVLAGVFRADPAFGFPAGTPDTAVAPSWHGMLHLGAGAVGFGCLIAACLLLGRRFAGEGRSRWALFSRVTGTVFLAAFVGIAVGGGSAPTILAFTAAVVLAGAWMSALAGHLYRRGAGGSPA